MLFHNPFLNGIAAAAILLIALFVVWLFRLSAKRKGENALKKYNAFEDYIWNACLHIIDKVFVVFMGYCIAELFWGYLAMLIVVDILVEWKISKNKIFITIIWHILSKIFLCTIVVLCSWRWRWFDAAALLLILVIAIEYIKIYCELPPNIKKRNRIIKL